MGKKAKGFGNVPLQFFVTAFCGRFSGRLAGWVVLFVLAIQRPVLAAEFEVSESIQKTIRFGFTVRNQNEQRVSGDSLAVYVPASTESQTLMTVDASLPFQLSTDDYGNNLALISLPEMAPHATLPSYAMFFFGLFVPKVIVDMKILARRA